MEIDSCLQDEIHNGVTLLEKGRYSSAIDAFTSLIDQLRLCERACSSTVDKHRKGQRETIAVLYNNRGQAKYKQVEFQSAIEDYTTALSYNRNLAAAYYNRGTIHYRMGNMTVALEDIRTATELDPNNQEFITGLKESSKLSASQERVELMKLRTAKRVDISDGLGNTSRPHAND